MEMNRRTFLENLFDGNYDPDHNLKLPQPEYHLISKKAYEEHEFFKQFIPEEHMTRYKDMSFCFIEDLYLHCYAYYKEGLRVGLDMKKELLED